MLRLFYRTTSLHCTVLLYSVVLAAKKPCPIQLDPVPLNWTHWTVTYGQDQDGLRATGLIQRHQAACLDHNCTLQQERPLLQPPGSVATMFICYGPIQLDRVQLVTARYPLWGPATGDRAGGAGTGVTSRSALARLYGRTVKP